MSTPVGQRGRLPQGESWQRAMDEGNRRLADGSTRRYLVRGRRIERDWWAYELVALPRKPRPVAPKSTGVLTKENVAELAARMPRCAQRAKASHGGETKVAWRTGALAYRVAATTGGMVYECELPAPAIGRHWHIATSKKRKARKR